MDKPIYLDHNATTPIDPAVLDAMQPYLSLHFGNPSSGHSYAAPPREAISAARSRVAALVRARPDAIVFTGSGSAANTLAIRGAALANRDRGDHIVTLTTEHPSVLKTLQSLERLHGIRSTLVPVDECGRVRLDAAAEAVTADTVLVTMQHANSETGTIQPVAEMARLARRSGALLHVDASQTAGKIGIDVAALGADLLTVTGHKMYAPKGIAALYRAPGLALEPVVHGGGQEDGLHAGTENTPYIVGLGEAARLAQVRNDTVRLKRLRDHLHGLLCAGLPGRVLLNGHPEERLPHVLNVSITGTDGRRLLDAAPEVAASTGSACHTGETAPSPVLLAMGLPPDRARAALRLTLGRWTTETDLDLAAKALISAAS